MIKLNIKLLTIVQALLVSGLVIADQPQEKKNKNNQSQQPQSQPQHQQPAHPSQTSGGHNQQPQHKQPMPKSKQTKSSSQSTSQLTSMIQDFSKNVQAIPKKQQPPKPSSSSAKAMADKKSSSEKSGSEKSSGSQASGSEKSESSSDKSSADKKAPSKDINKKYHEAVEKAYQSYAKLYEHIQKNHMSISQSQFDEVKKGAKKLFQCKNIQNKAWTKEKVKISGQGSQGQSSSQGKKQ